ncbi:MAG: type II toxin-antitoxin system RelE/ParE family toxin [Candidatus Omnitrophica bacterium]|nr:type II toxin-antitoxin system RelE/ParE family toxin [Candidatus Omnitrophota bacterium]
MAVYRLELSNQAQRTIRRMAEREPALYKRVAEALDDLERDPFQGKPLKGELRGRYSYRIATYRIIYLVRRRELLVVVIDVGHRRDVYR